jgi:hypothetical protein
MTVSSADPFNDLFDNLVCLFFLCAFLSVHNKQQKRRNLLFKHTQQKHNMSSHGYLRLQNINVFARKRGKTIVCFSAFV